MMPWHRRQKNKTNDAPIQIGNTHHIGKRDSQQDSFGISDLSNAGLCARKGVFAVVADGMGGLADGGEISGRVVRTMLQFFGQEEPLTVEQELLQMLFAANDSVNRFLEGRERGGTTVAAVILRDGGLSWLSVGDSRIYLMRGGGLLQLNREHTYAAELDEKAAAGEISWGEAATDSQRAAVTGYLGQGRPGKIDRNLHPVRLIPGDWVLVMSDGVFGTLTDDEILETRRDTPCNSAEILREQVLSRQKPHQDNFTAVIIEYGGTRV